MRIKEGYNCPSCEFDLCIDCANKQKPVIAQFPAFESECKKGHRLEYFSGAPLAYRQKYGSNVAINCSDPPRGCRKMKISQGYNCPTCEFDLCVDCVKKPIPAPPPYDSECNRGHQLEYFKGIPEVYRQKYGSGATINCN
jgi:hypothetical protein